MGFDVSSAGTVLIVDDDPTICELIAAILALEGFESIVARDGTHALRAVRELRPDAITLDLDMPGLDGPEVLRSLRDDDDARKVPVVVVSANSETLSSRDKGQVVQTLTKPFEVPELVEAVSSAALGGLVPAGLGRAGESVALPARQ